MPEVKKQEKPPLSFDGQRDNEQLLFVFRRHFIAMRKGFYLLLIPFLVSSVPPLIWQTEISLFLFPVAGLLIGIIMFLYHFVLWYFTIYIVTDQRIRQVTQRSLFGREVIDLRLSKVQSISYNIPGFAGDIFHFGTIVIHTFVGDLVIHHVEHPLKIYNKLQDAVNNVVDKQGDHEEINQ
ncbi:PH domain-containing protein [Candidatus Saccharibacteria bacterium]|nr:PH domain-containing protein [Candidatus Saccharibacteria bacterium]